MIYLDTSVVVALLTPEQSSSSALDWFAQSREPLISSDWLITETHSALGMKQRLHGLSAEARLAAGEQFERLLQGGVELRPLDRGRFRQAAELLQDPALGLRAGDALHLAVALHSRCTQLASFDIRMQQAAAVLGLSPALAQGGGQQAPYAKNLETLGAAALAELLIEVSGGNAVIQRRRRLALAAGEGTEGVVQEVRKRLTAIDRSSTFLDSGKRKALVSDLEAQLQAITGPIATGDPKQAFDLLRRFLELSEAVLERCTDSTGVVIGVFERAAKQLGPLAQAAQLEPETLAQHAAELLAENTFEQFDALVPALKDALGDWA